MQRKKSTAPEVRPSERKPTTVKSSAKSKTTVPPISLPTSQNKLERGKANLKKLLKKIEEGDNPYAERNSFRPGESQHEQLKEEYTTNNVSSAYTTSLENINTKEQTFATNEENRHEYELKSIWAEEFEEIAARKMDKRFKVAEVAERQASRQRHNKSCSDRFTSRKNLEVVRSAFNSLDSCKSSKTPKMKPTTKPKKKTKKPVTMKKKKEVPRSSLTPSSLNTPRSLRSHSDAIKNNPTSLLELRSPKKKLEIPYTDMLSEFAAPNNVMLPNEQRKITEVSDEELQCSIVKSKTLKNNSFKKVSGRLLPTAVPYKKGKAQALRCLREQIKNKVESLYPTLKLSEKRLVCAVILIQRLWRQSKVKNIIGQFLTPKKAGTLNQLPHRKAAPSLPQPIQERSFERLDSSSKETPNKDAQIVPLLFTPSIKYTGSPRQPPPFYSRSEDVSAASSKSSLPSSRQQASILKFVDSYRTMILDSKKSRKQPKDLSRPNFFSLTTSLSDKCLLGGMYRKIFSFGSEEGQNSSCESKLHEKLMIRKGHAIVSSPPEQLKLDKAPLQNEICTVLSSERFYTEVKEQQVVLPESSPHAEELIKPKQPEGKADIRETIVNQMVDMLINEFSEEFVKHIKQLKKKKSLPGIKISKTTINRYLDGMIDHLMEYHQKQIVHNLNKIAGVDPKTLLRFMRDDFDDADDVESQDSQYCTQSILPKTVFFDYQKLFEKQWFKVSKEEEKYVNFIEGVLTVHNKSLLDCFTEEMELIRVYGVRGKPYPWERSFTRTTERVTEDNLKLKLVQTKERVKEISSYHLGNLDRRMPNREFIDQQNLLFSIREDYNRDHHQWDYCFEEMLEVQLLLSSYIFDWLTEEMVQEISLLDNSQC